jgi:hypothetical protein
MRRFALVVAAMVGLAFTLPRPVLASQWGSGYGDPWGFCPEGSFLPYTYTSIVTNDPHVGSNPEQDTFWGVHAYPGYDDWFGYWYGDFRGSPGDDSGWRYITTSYYGWSPGHWNFANWGWAVHGHAKQYIAYHNWYFGGRCGMGWYGASSPPPYMADVYGYPVVDIYVDSVPPNPPRPRVVGVTPNSVSFTWDPVTDRGDGAGPDYWASGFDHFTSWLTVGSGAAQQLANTPTPRTLTAAGLSLGQTACVHVIAADRLANATGDQSLCAQALTTPHVPPPPPPPAIDVSPKPVGLTGLDAWFWLSPAPTSAVTTTSVGGVTYTVSLTPTYVGWSFGDGAGGPLPAPAGFGVPYPSQSTVRHVYETQRASGYMVTATISYTGSWTATVGGTTYGPYPLSVPYAPMATTVYPVRQAQVEVTWWR